MDRRAFLAAAAAAVAAPAHAQTGAPFALARAYSAQRNGRALVILRNGVPVVEDMPAGPETAHDVGAASSSFVPALAAALVEDRLLSLDEAASMTLVEWTGHPVKYTITLRALLNRTCGLSGAGRVLTASEACALEPLAQPGERFIDDPAPIQIFVEVARRKLVAAGAVGDPGAYLTQRVLGPIGCAPIAWRRNEYGDVSFTDGIAVGARGWARWGELLRRAGIWRARTLLSPDALRDACRGSWVQPRHGFGFWLAWPAARDLPPHPGSDLWSAAPAPPPDLVMAASVAGDRLFVLPTQRLVVARQSTGRAAWSDAVFVSLLLSGR